MVLYIKYMVSLRCIIMVKEELKKLSVQFNFVELGLIETRRDLTPDQHDQLKAALLKLGLEFMDNKKVILTERIKHVITEMIHYSNEFPEINYSEYISEKLRYDYTYLSNLFSEVNGITIQQFIILHKIERVKELLLYNELSLTQIAYQLDYSSVAHLSNQFRKITGQSPSIYKQHRAIPRENLENL